MAMAASHDNWYQQRYGSAQVNKRQRQLYAARTAHYEEIKELQQEKRETYQHDAVAVFAEHGITYEVRGHGWLCQVGAEAIYYWPKSGRWRLKGQRNTWGSYGAQDFLNRVLSHQQDVKGLGTNSRSEA